MPIFMDRHDVSEEVTAEIVADLHQKDLKIQQDFGCRGLTYWFDDKRKTAFCLIEAPTKEAIKKMHAHAHGEVPNEIIEVDNTLVESFLGRIEDPTKSQNTQLNIINDPAFRVILVAEISQPLSKTINSQNKDATLYLQAEAIPKLFKTYHASIVNRKLDYFLTSFNSVTNAVICALEIHKVFDMKNSGEINIGISSGLPVTDKPRIFENTIKTSERFCRVVKGSLVMSAEVKDLYESENSHLQAEKNLINVINPLDEKFINLLMEHLESFWHNTKLGIDDLSEILGYSKSQLYRKMIGLTGKPLNVFIREYRLNRALELLCKNSETIAQVAFDTGFNSPAYFSKCFQDTFGLLPSQYQRSRCSKF